jgi:hypothetical protein
LTQIIFLIVSKRALDLSQDLQDLEEFCSPKASKCFRTGMVISNGELEKGGTTSGIFQDSESFCLCNSLISSFFLSKEESRAKRETIEENSTQGQNTRSTSKQSTTEGRRQESKRYSKGLSGKKRHPKTASSNEELQESNVVV